MLVKPQINRVWTLRTVVMANTEFFARRCTTYIDELHVQQSDTVLLAMHNVDCSRSACVEMR